VLPYVIPNWYTKRYAYSVPCYIVYTYVFYILGVCTRNHWYICLQMVTYHFVSSLVCIYVVHWLCSLKDFINGAICFIMSNTQKIQSNNWCIARLYLITNIHLLLNAQPSGDLCAVHTGNQIIIVCECCYAIIACWSNIF
jgi:hypothetical protein